MRIRQFHDRQQACLYCGQSDVTLGASGQSCTTIYTRNPAAAATIARLMHFNTVAPDRAGTFSFISRLSADQIKDRIAEGIANI